MSNIIKDSKLSNIKNNCIKQNLGIFYDLPEAIIENIYNYGIFKPNLKKDLINAVNLWCNDKEKAYKIYADISTWDTANISNMSGIFKDKINFNNNISKWNVSNVTDMSYMFYNAASFNIPLNNWNVIKVKDMSYMFKDAINFNQSLDYWSVDNVEYMNYMFFNAVNFERSLDWYYSDKLNFDNVYSMFTGSKGDSETLENHNQLDDYVYGIFCYDGYFDKLRMQIPDTEEGYIEDRWEQYSRDKRHFIIKHLHDIEEANRQYDMNLL